MKNSTHDTDDVIIGHPNYCTKRSLFTFAGLPRFLFWPNGILLLVSSGACTTFSRISIPRACLQMLCLRKYGHEHNDESAVPSSKIFITPVPNCNFLNSSNVFAFSLFSKSFSVSVDIRGIPEAAVKYCTQLLPRCCNTFRFS